MSDILPVPEPIRTNIEESGKINSKNLHMFSNSPTRSEQQVDMDIALSPINKSKLTVVDTIYFIQPEQPGYSIDCRYARTIDTNEQPYIRRLCIGKELIRLDIGWLDKVSMIIVENREGVFKQVQPTEQEREEAGKKIVLLGDAEGRQLWSIFPGESFKGCPINPKSLYLVCKHGEAKVVVTVLPG